MQEAGLIEQWTRVYTPKDTCPQLGVKTNSATLTLDVAMGVFVVLAVGLVTALIVLFTEIGISQMSFNRQKMRGFKFW